MVDTIGEHKCKQKDANNNNKEMLTIKSELKMLTSKSICVIHNDLRGYTSPVKKEASDANGFKIPVKMVCELDAQSHPKSR